MSMVKQKMKEIIESQPDDASYDEIIRELAFEQMVERGLKDARNGRVTSNEEMRHWIRTCYWVAAPCSTESCRRNI